MLQPGRKFTAGSGYRYGFNGKEMDNEVSGDGNLYDYGFRIYNPKIGKFLSVDPLMESYPWYTPYQFAGNTPLQAIDLDGLEEHKVMPSWMDYGIGFLEGFFGSAEGMRLTTCGTEYERLKQEQEAAILNAQIRAEGIKRSGILKWTLDEANNMVGNLANVIVTATKKRFDGSNSPYENGKYDGEVVGLVSIVVPIIGEYRAAKTIREVKEVMTVAAETEVIGEIYVKEAVTYRNGYRTPDGKFASPSGSPPLPGADAEQQVWNAVLEKEGWGVIKGRVYVKDGAGNVRVYDGVAQSPSGNNIGLEIKSGTAPYNGTQKAFDKKLNSAVENVASGTGVNEGVEVNRAILIRKKPDP